MIDSSRIVAGARRRLERLVRGDPTPELLLEMVWPSEDAAAAPEVSISEGYRLRQFEQGDEHEYFRLLEAADMGRCRLEYWENHLLPDGFFVVEHTRSGALVATCMASHHPAPRHPRAGNLGWLAADPAHRGRGLGRAAAAAVTARLIERRYRRIYLETHDSRLAAIRIYLAMGWLPLIYANGMTERWARVYEALDWRAEPKLWIHEPADAAQHGANA